MNAEAAYLSKLFASDNLTREYEPVTYYATRYDLECQVVYPALGEYADDYDVDAIVAELTEYMDYNPHWGYSFNDAYDGNVFWDIVDRHEL